MRLVGLTLVAVLLSTAANAAADVTFTNSETYVDATFEWPKSYKNKLQVQDAIRKMFSDLAGKYLAPGQTLKVNITQIDLAGRIEPAISLARDIRIMQSVTWPRLRFAYEVSENEALVASGDADLADLNYLNGFNRFGSDRLRYERQMVADWFRKTLARKA